MKKIVIVTFLLLNLCLLTGCSQKEQGPVNKSTWSECGSSFACLADNAGFDFKLRIGSNFEARATKGIAEVTFPYISDDNYITVRKTLNKTDEDTSDIKTKYVVEKEVSVNDIPTKVRGNGSLFYVANFNSENAHYSIYDKTGMTINDLQMIQNLLIGSEYGYRNK